MYCPKCGSEIKDGSTFCSKCGAKMSVREKNVKETLGGMDVMKSLEFPKMGNLVVSKKISGVIACVVVILGLIFFSRLLKPVFAPIDSTAVMEAYLEDSTRYQNNQGLYQECLAYEIDDLTSQITSQLDSMLSRFGISLRSSEAEKKINYLREDITEYFSQDTENQKSLVRAITEYSDFRIVNQVRKGKKIKADVTVEHLDLNAVNRNIVEDSMSIRNIAKLVTAGSEVSKLIDIGTGDVSFVLKKFVEKAETTDERESYTGTVEFIYNKKKKCWEVDYVDRQLIRAYFGIE
ncbi:zinc-ribbon domain-containing protein [Brotaphodocola sp.]|uniref:zinc ribbon domain-containing protein n=1 Tax=Brotaphodocola sp. TaxID=3073577 RepID=UPI003D7EBE2C